MIGLGRTDEAITRDIKPLIHLTEIGRHFFCERGGLDALLARGLRHLQAVLVGARQEEDVAAALALEAGDDVGRDRFIGMAELRASSTEGRRGGKEGGNRWRCWWAEAN